MSLSLSLSFLVSGVGGLLAQGNRARCVQVGQSAIVDNGLAFGGPRVRVGTVTCGLDEMHT